MYAVIIWPLRSSFQGGRFSNLREHGQFRFLGNYLPTPPLSQHFALSEKYVLMLAYGRSRWAVSQKPHLMLELLCFKLQIELSRCQSYYLSVIFFFPFLFSLNRVAAEINLKERPSN